MQRYLSDLLKIWNRHELDRNRTIYIIGSGPSLRVFPIDFLADKFTIGLNEAYKCLPFSPTINITIHPRLIPPKQYNWLTKKKDNIDITKYYLFNNIDDLNILYQSSKHSPESLYTGRGIQTAALHLSALLNAKYAILVGVDMGLLGGDHHAIDCPVQYHQYTANQVHKEYYYYTRKCCEILKSEYNLEVMSLSPLLGEICRQDDYLRLLQNKGLKPYPPPKSIETAKRTTPLVTDYL